MKQNEGTVADFLLAMLKKLPLLDFYFCFFQYEAL